MGKMGSQSGQSVSLSFRLDQQLGHDRERSVFQSNLSPPCITTAARRAGPSAAATPAAWQSWSPSPPRLVPGGPPVGRVALPLSGEIKAPHFGAGLQARELRDIPRLEAFCRVAPVVRFSVRAMLAVRVFFFASVFNVRTSDAVHSRRFDFLAI